jgi:hypothetical protein
VLGKKDAKGLALSILSKRKPEGSREHAAREEDQESEVSGLEAAADEIISAVESKDAKALSESLKAFIEQCQGDEEPEEDESEEA